MNKQQIGTAIIVINEENKILLGKRKNSFKQGFFGLPGGRLEKKEKLVLCAVRELKEETNLDSKKISYLCVVKEWQEDEDHDFVHFIFVCQEWTNKLELLEPDKCESWQWFDLDKLPENVLPGHLAGINAQKNKTEENLIDI